MDPARGLHCETRAESAEDATAKNRVNDEILPPSLSEHSQDKNDKKSLATSSALPSAETHSSTDTQQSESSSLPKSVVDQPVRPPSHDARSERSPTASEKEDGSAGTGSKQGYPPEAFQGVWKRTAQMNYDEILIALGLNKKLRDIALSSGMVVTIAVASFSAPNSSDHKSDKDTTYMRVREINGGHDSAICDLNTDSTYNISLDSDSRSSKNGRRGTTRSKESKFFGKKYNETSRYGEDSSVGSSGSATYPHGNVLSVNRQAVNGRMRIISRYFLVEKKGNPQLRLTTICKHDVPQFKGGPLVEVSTEATTVFELVSRTPEAGFEVVAPESLVSESMRKSVSRMYSDTAFSQPSEDEKLTKSPTGSTRKRKRCRLLPRGKILGQLAT